MCLLIACGTGQGPQSEPGTAGQSNPAPSLFGTTWEWIGTTTPVERFEATDPARYTLRLQSDSQAEFQFDCNSGRGMYELADNRISFAGMISTRMACPPDSQDGLFMRQLGQVTTHFMQDGELFLEMPYDSGTMRFRAAAAPGE
jgi:heat shock protein HslJ